MKYPEVGETARHYESDTNYFQGVIGFVGKNGMVTLVDESNNQFTTHRTNLIRVSKRAKGSFRRVKEQLKVAQIVFAEILRMPVMPPSAKARIRQAIKDINKLEEGGDLE